mmetsp:Transcript_117126/g.184252  ORF Transcript_117126/g.184252 Transcript_117126/m.184252 type:complete len:204 (-) Transcript_117126:564-1175(-)
MRTLLILHSTRFFVSHCLPMKFKRSVECGASQVFMMVHVKWRSSTIRAGWLSAKVVPHYMYVTLAIMRYGQSKYHLELCKHYRSPLQMLAPIFVWNPQLVSPLCGEIMSTRMLLRKTRRMVKKTVATVSVRRTLVTMRMMTMKMVLGIVISSCWRVSAKRTKIRIPQSASQPQVGMSEDMGEIAMLLERDTHWPLVNLRREKF